jgi:hypothetical protein
MAAQERPQAGRVPFFQMLLEERERGVRVMVKKDAT